ncbi:hypothetical protein WJX72_001058 [[Myrmecia] bisecta]|uniref:DUF3054 domain-containing protein n=1 Tax=[Myrmecia] bisecta TaxID=41462 RepID=A0AAW1Q9L6_9CHLO
MQALPCCSGGLITRPAPHLPADRPVPSGLKLQKVERLGEEAWAGVAAVDRGEGGADTDLTRVLLLVGGDLAALLVFAAIGRNNHGEGLDLGAVFGTALPFLIGWFGAAGLLKAYGKEAQGGQVGPAAVVALKAWGLGIPVGLVLRSVQRGYVVPTPFIIVSMVATLVCLVGWRAVLAALTPVEEAAQANEDHKQAAARRRRNKQGSPFEFLQLLASLTKRW